MYTVTPLKQGIGCVVRAKERAPMETMPPATVMELMKEHAFVHFQNFDLDLPRFEAYAAQFESRAPSVYTEELRQGFVNADAQGTVQAAVQVRGEAPPPVSRLVNLSNDHLYVHSENAYLPLPLELLWFFCVAPAKERGATTVVDGVRFLKEMRPDIRAFFEKNKIRYEMKVGPEDWTRTFGVASVKELVELLSPMPGVSCDVLDEHDNVLLSHVTSAIRRTKHGGEDAFINQVLFDFKAHLSCKMEDRSPIPKEILGELRAQEARSLYRIPWEKTECAIIDNLRLLHGREGFDDPARDIRVFEIQSAVD